MKKVVAVAPYIHPGCLNFKFAPYNAWMAEGGKTIKAYYPWRLLHGLAYRYALPCIKQSHKEAHLRFVEPVSINFDTFPDTAFYEIIPMIWDCWPCYFEKVCAWFEKYRVKTAIFTSSQTAERMRERFPEMNIMFCPEGINVDEFDGGLNLVERGILMYEIGSVKRSFFKKKYPREYSLLFNKPKEWGLENRGDFLRILQNTKLTVIFPKSITEPQIAGDVETLTQRYWECMLSRMVMVGHAPKELIDLIGYNPVIEIENGNELKQIQDILSNIGDYQRLVNRNNETALRIGAWSHRMNDVKAFLREIGYNI